MTLSLLASGLYKFGLELTGGLFVAVPDMLRDLLQASRYTCILNS